MSQETGNTLQTSLDMIDRIRRRVVTGGWLAVAVTLAAYGYFYYVLNTSHNLEKLVSASLLALTCLIAWAGYAVILMVMRMTSRILRAIELALSR